MRILPLLLLCLACRSSEPLTTPAQAPDATGAAAPAATLPNIVVVLTDDMRWELMPYMPTVKSRLADSGVTFTKAFVNSPLCCPSRTSLLTGWYQHTTHVRGNGPAPYGGAGAFSDVTTIATELHAAGYVTALVGKYLNGYAQLPANYVPPGWDEWRAYWNVRYNNASLVEKAFDSSAASTRSYSGYSPGTLRNRLVSFITRAPANQPLFLLFTPYAPHREAALNTYPIPATQDLGKCATVPLPAWSAAFNESDVADKPAYVSSSALLASLEIAQADTGRRKQCESLFAVDRAVNDILASLASTGRLANTLIIFGTDNGYLLGEHRLFQRKGAMYEEAVRTPLIVRGLGARLGAVDTNLVQLIDVTATARAVAGLFPNAAGRDLRVAASTSGTFTTDAILIEMDNAAAPYESFAMVRTHRYAYAEYPAGSPSHGPFVELYDLALDPAELQNVAKDAAYAGIVSTLHSRLQQLQQSP